MSENAWDWLKQMILTKADTYDVRSIEASLYRSPVLKGQAAVCRRVLELITTAREMQVKEIEGMKLNIVRHETCMGEVRGVVYDKAIDKILGTIRPKPERSDEDEQV